MGYSPQGHKESDMTEFAGMHIVTSFLPCVAGSVPGLLMTWYLKVEHESAVFLCT